MGQRNGLDALCKRYSVDNSHRDLHGALLDADLLLEVDLAMTGGQGALTLDQGLSAIADDLIGRGEVVSVAPASFASVTAVALREEGGVQVLEPVFDPRKGGAVTVGRAETVTGGAPRP